jgi:homoserine O-acetyltransferase
MTACTPPLARFEGYTPSTSDVLDVDCTIPLSADFRLELSSLPVGGSIQARMVGNTHAPVVLVLGGISANRHVIDSSTSGVTQTGWWRDGVGAGQALELQKYRILSFDFLPGNDTKTEIDITPGDQARIAEIVCDYFGIERLHAFIGYSYGGMVALQFGARFPHRVKQLVIASASHRPHPMGTAWRSIQRKMVRFGLDFGQPERALSLARELGMTTYRTAKEFGERFAHDQFEVEKYLSSRGEAFVGKMPPHRYLSLSKSIDLHYVEPKNVHASVTLIAFKQDQLVLLDEVRLLKSQLPFLSGYYELDSIYGHDGFLKETELLEGILKKALAGF